MLMIVKLPTIWYVPGMISLLCIPVVWIALITTPPVQTVIKLNLPSNNENGPFAFTQEGFLHRIPPSDIPTFYLDGDQTLNEKKLAVFQQEARRMKYAGKVNEALKIHFTDDLSYRQLAAIFNQMLEDDQKRYALLDNDFYLLGDRVDNSEQIDIPLFQCGFTPLVPEPPAMTLLDIIQAAKVIFVRNWLLITGFVLLILLPAMFFIKRSLSARFPNQSNPRC